MAAIVITVVITVGAVAGNIAVTTPELTGFVSLVAPATVKKSEI